MLEKVDGLKLPKAVKTGTTIVGLIFKVGYNMQIIFPAFTFVGKLNSDSKVYLG